MARATYDYYVRERYDRNLFDEVGVYRAPNAKKACRMAAKECDLNFFELEATRR